MTEQFNSGESSFIFGINFHKTNIGRMIVGKHAWQQEEDQKRRYQYCSDVSGTIVYLRALQGHSGRSLIDPSLQANVIIQCGLFQHIYHMGCAWARGKRRIDDYWNIDGSRDLSDPWTGFTQFTLLEEKPPDGWPGGWGTRLRSKRANEER